MWQVEGRRVPTDWLNHDPMRTFYDFDGPKVFVCRSAISRERFLAYYCDEDDEATRYLIVPSSDDLESRLAIGDIDIRGALWQQTAWIFDIDNDWNAVRAWAVNIADLPPKVIPQPGVMLWGHLPPRTTALQSIACSGMTELPSVTVLPSRITEFVEAY